MGWRRWWCAPGNSGEGPRGSKQLPRSRTMVERPDTRVPTYPEAAVHMVLTYPEAAVHMVPTYPEGAGHVGADLPRRGCTSKPRVALTTGARRLSRTWSRLPWVRVPSTTRTLKGFHNTGRSDPVQPFQGWMVLSCSTQGSLGRARENHLAPPYLGNPGLCSATLSGLF